MELFEYVANEENSYAVFRVEILESNHLYKSLIDLRINHRKSKFELKIYREFCLSTNRTETRECFLLKLTSAIKHCDYDVCRKRIKKLIDKLMLSSAYCLGIGLFCIQFS